MASEALTPAFASEDSLHAGLKRYRDEFAAVNRSHTAAKLGLTKCLDEDLELMQALQALLQSAEVDMTLFFRGLADVDLHAPTLEPLRGAFYDQEKMQRAEPEFNGWLARYATRARRDSPAPAERRARMHAVNPRYVLRNYLAQLAIDRAEQGDDTGIRDLLVVLRRPYDDQFGSEQYAQRRPDWARNRAGCSMLSCSS